MPQITKRLVEIQFIVDYHFYNYVYPGLIELIEAKFLYVTSTGAGES